MLTLPCPLAEIAPLATTALGDVGDLFGQILIHDAPLLAFRAMVQPGGRALRVYGSRADSM